MSVSIVGEHSDFFRVDHFGSSSGQQQQQQQQHQYQLPTRIGFGECASIRVSFVVDESNREEYLHQTATANATNARPPSMDAVLVLSVSVAGGQQVDTWIELRVDFAQEEDSGSNATSSSISSNHNTINYNAGEEGIDASFASGVIYGVERPHGGGTAAAAAASTRTESESESLLEHPAVGSSNNNNNNKVDAALFESPITTLSF